MVMVHLIVFDLKLASFCFLPFIISNVLIDFQSWGNLFLRLIVFHNIIVKGEKICFSLLRTLENNQCLNESYGCSQGTKVHISSCVDQHCHLIEMEIYRCVFPYIVIYNIKEASSLAFGTQNESKVKFTGTEMKISYICVCARIPLWFNSGSELE